MPAPAESRAPCAGVVSAGMAADATVAAKLAEAEAEAEAERVSNAIAKP